MAIFLETRMGVKKYIGDEHLMSIAERSLMSKRHPRMARESRTIETMIHMYCRDHHGRKGTLCHGCLQLLQYAVERLEKCPFQEGKTTCSKCPVHCYKSENRDRIRAVMRYAGPRMIYRHPIMAVFHMIDGRREKPVRPH